jgi:hypothetical protein
MNNSRSDSYAAAGVDVTAGYSAVKLMKQHVARTMTAGADCDIGGFGGLFEMDLTGMTRPVLVSGTDGVGTKLKLAFLLDKHDAVGIDCVAMCVNDVLCAGAKPLLFLDYIACGKLVPEKIAQIVSGVADGCVQAGAALVGGETAEMPGFYPIDEYDLAGFTVGAVDRSKLLARVEGPLPRCRPGASAVGGDALPGSGAFVVAAVVLVADMADDGAVRRLNLVQFMIFCRDMSLGRRDFTDFLPGETVINGAADNAAGAVDVSAQDGGFAYIPSDPQQRAVIQNAGTVNVVQGHAVFIGPGLAAVGAALHEEAVMAADVGHGEALLGLIPHSCLGMVPGGFRVSGGAAVYECDAGEPVDQQSTGRSLNQTGIPVIQRTVSQNPSGAPGSAVVGAFVDDHPAAGTDMGKTFTGACRQQSAVGAADQGGPAVISGTVAIAKPACPKNLSFTHVFSPQ